MGRKSLSKAFNGRSMILIEFYLSKIQFSIFNNKNHKIKKLYNKLEFHKNQSTNIDRKPFSNYKCDGSRTHFCSKTLCINQLQWYFI